MNLESDKLIEEFILSENMLLSTLTDIKILDTVMLLDDDDMSLIEEQHKERIKRMCFTKQELVSIMRLIDNDFSVF